MKRLLILLILVFVASTLYSCATHNAQAGAAAGTGLGAIAGQVISRSTGGTLIGAAVGWLVGSTFGDAADKYNTEQRVKALEQAELARQEREKAAAKKQQTQALAYPADEAPPGQWIVQKGRWEGGKWIPTHRVWQPINPEDDEK